MGRVIGLITAVVLMQACHTGKISNRDGEAYHIRGLNGSLIVDADWNKPQWKRASTLEISQVMGEIPAFVPRTKVKMLYDQENLYVIFKVSDRQVRSMVTEINGEVWDDACVELFFAPDCNKPMQYFNLEINAGGTPLMYYNTIPRKEYLIIPPEEIAKIEIASSLPATIDPEIKEEVCWTLEFKLPLEVIRKYGNVTQPVPGVVWKANLNKTASTTSNPHYITWKRIDIPEPDFHRPDFFGELVFQ